MSVTPLSKWTTGDSGTPETGNDSDNEDWDAKRRGRSKRTEEKRQRKRRKAEIYVSPSLFLSCHIAVDFAI